MKIYKITKQPILLREKKNIDIELHKRNDFAEVRETIKKVQLVRANSAKPGVNSGLPSGYKQNKKMLKNKGTTSFALTEHANNLASL